MRTRSALAPGAILPPSDELDCGLALGEHIGLQKAIRNILETFLRVTTGRHMTCPTGLWLPLHASKPARATEKERGRDCSRPLVYSQDPAFRDSYWSRRAWRPRPEEPIKIGRRGEGHGDSLGAAGGLWHSTNITPRCTGGWVGENVGLLQLELVATSVLQPGDHQVRARLLNGHRLVDARREISRRAASGEASGQGQTRAVDPKIVAGFEVLNLPLDRRAALAFLKDQAHRVEAGLGHDQVIQRRIGGAPATVEFADDERVAWIISA